MARLSAPSKQTGWHRQERDSRRGNRLGVPDIFQEALSWQDRNSPEKPGGGRMGHSQNRSSFLARMQRNSSSYSMLCLSSGNLRVWLSRTQYSLWQRRYGGSSD